MRARNFRSSACADVRWRPVSEQIDQLSVGFGESVIRRLPRQIGGYFACAGGPMQTSLCGCLAGAGYVVLSMMRS